MQKIVNVLVFFNNATQTFSHVYKPTAKQFFREAVNLASAFCEFFDAPYVSYFCSFMKEKFLKYYSHIPHIYCIAFILDPRYRVNALQQCLDYYYASFFGPFPIYEDKPIDPKQEYNNVSNLFHQLLNEFHAQYGNTPPPPTRISSSKGKSFLKSTFGNLMKKIKSTPVVEQSSINELSTYLTFHVDYEERDDFAFLKWWKDKERTFPVFM
ncbi:unnamed protein product [Cuscuta epithymum]|uniref:hAT-like transposase RNase-H fold domain-containing protein n=1 Tax=Cuscuta epithymum TaxID=186058 RepID=A0AAV0C8J2_9ASTE|nr:unnamed protein product [Cuscuta epithymum]CAH9142571.1 unnamed protein product [Cuscuta epithymum]